MTQRAVQTIRRSQATRDGDGVAIQRVPLVGEPATDPLLLLDELRSEFREDFAGGFPPHPHRGMQTLTYLKAGGIRHEDSLGNVGEIVSGGVQWMSAGSGVVHSEMPTLDTRGLHGFQLWFNLPAVEKANPPRYRDIPAAGLPVLDFGAGQAVLIAGEWCINDVAGEGALSELGPQADMTDLRLAPGARAEMAVPAQARVSIYVYNGSLLQAAGIIPAGNLVVMEEGDALSLDAGAGGLEALIIVGRPIGEPVVGYGPFVMNTREEIDLAVREYQAGTFLKHKPETR